MTTTCPKCGAMFPASADPNTAVCAVCGWKPWMVVTNLWRDEAIRAVVALANDAPAPGGGLAPGADGPVDPEGDAAFWRARAEAAEAELADLRHQLEIALQLPLGYEQRAERDRKRAEAAEAEVERLTPRRDSAEIKFFFADAPHVVAAMKAAEDALAQAVAEVERLRAKLDAAREACAVLETAILEANAEADVDAGRCWVPGVVQLRFVSLRAILADEPEVEE
jgi:predicted  nucleic acid-binding Zn-ribbon protein